MFATLVATTALCFSPAADDPAALLPADTMLYFGTDSLNESAKLSKKSAMHLIMNEPEVKAFFQKPLSMLDRVLGDVVKDSGMDAPPVTVTDLVRGSGDAPPVGQLFMALTHVDVQNENGPDIGLVVGIEMLNEDDLAMLRGLWDKIPAPEEETSHSGRPYFKKSMDPSAPALSMTFIDNMAVLSLSESVLQGVIDRAAGSRQSLASSDQYSRFINEAGGLRAGGSTMFVRPAAMSGLLRQGAAMALMADGEMDMIPKMTGFIDSLGIEAIKSVGMSSFRDGDGMMHSTGIAESDPDVRGFVSSLMASTGPLDVKYLAAAPKDSMSVSGSSFPNVAEIYDFCMNTLEMFDADKAAEARGHLAELTGEIDLRNDVLAYIGGSYYSYQMPNQGFMGQPASVGRLDSKDPQALMDNLGKLLERIGAVTGFEVPLKTEEHNGLPLYELDLSKTPAAMTMWKPGMAIDGDHLVFSMESKDLLKKALDGELGSSSINEKVEFKRFVDSLSREGDVIAVSYVDLSELFSSMYGQLAGTAQMMGQGMGDLPIDLSLLPTEGSIKKHLGDSFGGSVVSADGRTSISRSVSQFGMGDFMPLAVVAAMYLTLGEADMLPTETIIVEVDPLDVALNDLRQLKAGMTVYKISMGGYPDNLAALVQPLPDYPNGCLGTSDLPVDPWGNNYLFRLNGKKVVLWSAGPDGVDQAGQGDDIVK